ncbi:MAG: ECF transporter S component [Planctomycetota bacterium]
MNGQRVYFSLHELLIMAALAALGGVSSSAVSWVGGVVHTLTGLPGGLQSFAGIHVLWLVLAVGLVRKPGSATVTGLLKGAVELLSGSRHGLVVVLVSGLAGLTVDGVWILTGRRDRLVSYVLAGGLGAASNLLVFKLFYSLPSHRAVTIALAALTPVAFVSGAVLAGLLGWSLMDALRRAGVAGIQSPRETGPPGGRAWVGAGLLAFAAAVIGTALFFASAPGKAEPPDHAPPPESGTMSRP